MLSLIAGQPCQFTPMRTGSIGKDEQTQETNVEKEDLILLQNIMRGREIFVILLGSAFEHVKLFTLKTICKNVIFVKAGAFLIGGKSKLHIYRKVWSFDERISHTFF